MTQNAERTTMTKPSGGLKNIVLVHNAKKTQAVALTLYSALGSTTTVAHTNA